MATFLRRNLEGCYVFASPPKAIMKADLSKCHTLTVPSSRLAVRKGCGKIHAKAVSTEPVSNFRRQVHCLEQQWETEQGPLTPPPLEGRLHVPVQTEQYLERLSTALEEKDTSTQTDVLLDKPPTPLFVPAKTGLDKETQIWEGELFDFEAEVQPVLDILVAQTLEQALVEVIQEEEMREMLDTQRRYEKIRMAELAERQRHEELDRRLFEERRYRLVQHQLALQLEQQLQAKVAATHYSRTILKDILDSLMARMEDLGFFDETAVLTLERTFIPWLTSKVTDEISSAELCRLLLDALIAEALSLDEREARELFPKKLSEESLLGEDEVAEIREVVNNLLKEVEDKTDVEATLHYLLDEVELHETVRKVLMDILDALDEGRDSIGPETGSGHT